MKVLTKEHGLAVFEQTAPGVWDFSPNFSTSAWEKVTPSSFVSSTYFDLAGMSMEEKTLFFEAAGTQSPLAPSIVGAVAGDHIVIADLMTTSPLTPLQAVTVMVHGNFPPAVLSFQETVYGRVDQWVVHIDTATWGSATLTNTAQIGSMMPTASDRVYSYRIVTCTAVGTGAASVTVSQARHILQAKAKEEPDHEYMMRLLRSYQLQQEPDVD